MTSRDLVAGFLGKATLVSAVVGQAVGVAVALEASLRRDGDIIPVAWRGRAVANSDLSAFANREVTVHIVDVGTALFEARARVTQTDRSFLTLEGIDSNPPFQLRPERYE